MKPKVSIIVLNWNGGKDTLECLESLKRINYTNYVTIVVDNASTDGSVELIREKLPEVEIIQNRENLGFAEGMNIGIRKVKSQYILLLNQDTVVDKDFLKELVEVAESDPKIGIVGPKIYYYQDTSQNSQFSIPNSRFSNIICSYGTRFATGSALKMKIPYVRALWIGVREEDRGQYDNINVVESITGCCMLIKSEVIDKIGLLDKRLFILHEDDDYCIRARRAGYKICVAPKSIIWHKVSTAIRSYEATANLFNIYYITRNWLLVTRRHFGVRIFSKILFAYIVKVLPIYLFSPLRRKWFKNITVRLYAYLDALALRTPKRFFR